MEGFDAALNGTFDVADQVWGYVRQRAGEHLDAARAEKDAIDSREGVEARRERVRETFLDAVGGLPDRPDDLAVERTDHRERDGYDVELLTFESLPGVHVTANCYVPDEEGPHPGVLFLCGHSEPAKGDALNQRMCADLALNGFVVLVLDPLCQGERTQYDAESHPATVSGGGGTFAHAYAGQKCFYAGSNLARYMVADARSGLDYLCERPDVDADRVGVTGTSGGGTMTMYLALVDDRPAALAPCCSVSTWRERLKTGGRTHAEDALTGSLAAGIDYDDLLAGAAPRPVCVGAAAADRYFPVEGTRETVGRVREYYEFYDAADRVSLTVADTRHCAVWDLRDGVGPFLSTHLDAGTYETHDPDPVAPDELRCTSAGSVRAAFPDERTVDGLTREYVAERYPNAGSDPDPTEVDPERVRRAVVEAFALDRDGCALSPRILDRTTEGGLTVEHVWFRTERDPDTVAAGVLVTDPDVEADAPVVVCYEDGTETVSERSDEIAALARERGAALVVDPRGVGGARNRTIPVPSWASGYDGVYGTAFKLANDAMLLGSPLVGLRTYDVRRAATVLRDATGAERVSFTGTGTGALHALYAAVVTDGVERVDCRDLPPSFHDCVTGEWPLAPERTAFDVLGASDLPHVRAALASRGVEVTTG